MPNFHSNTKAQLRQKTAKQPGETPAQAAARIAEWKLGVRGGRYRNPAVSDATLICAELSLVESGGTITIPELHMKTEVDFDTLRTIMAQLVTNGNLTEDPTEFFHPVTLGEDWEDVPDTL